MGKFMVNCFFRSGHFKTFCKKKPGQMPVRDANGNVFSEDLDQTSMFCYYSAWMDISLLHVLVDLLHILAYM